MDVSNFQILKDTGDSVHVKHPNGKTLIINKSGLSEKAKSHLQKFAVGGIAESNPDSGSEQVPVVAAAQPSVLDQISNSVEAPAAAATIPQVQGGTETPIAQPQQITPQNVAPDPLVQDKLSTADLLSNQQKNISDFTDQSTAINNSMAKASQDYQKAAQADIAAGQASQAEYKAKDDKFAQDYQNQAAIDPNRFYKNQSTGSKIASAIGLLFSGFGSGLSGGQNLALNEINKAVENDINSQRHEQDKTQTLFKMNHEAMGDDRTAHALTQNQLWTTAQARIQAATAQLQNPALKLKGQEMINNLEAQKIKNQRDLGMLTAGSGTQGSPGLLQADPLRLVTDMVPAEHQKQVITELGQAKSAKQNESQILELFDKAAKDTRPATGRSLTGVANTLIPGYHPAVIKNLDLLADPLIHDNEGRINVLEQQHVQNNWPQGFDSDSSVAQKRAAIQNFINHKKGAPTAVAFGIDPSRFAATSETSQAPQIAMKDGIQYRKVPGGWQKVQ